MSVIDVLSYTIFIIFFSQPKRSGSVSPGKRISFDFTNHAYVRDMDDTEGDVHNNNVIKTVGDDDNSEDENDGITETQTSISSVHSAPDLRLNER